MSGNRIICIDNEIMFRTSFTINNAVGISAPIEYFMTKFGLVIPIGRGGLTPFVINGLMFNNRTENTELLSRYDTTKLVKEYQAFLIDRLGNCYYMNNFTFDPFRFYLNVIPCGPGMQFSLSSDCASDDVNNTALVYSDDIDKVFEIIMKTTPLMAKADYYIFKLSELINWVVESFRLGATLSYTGDVRKPRLTQPTIDKSISDLHEIG